VYGILRGCDTIIRQARARHTDFLHLDHGYFARSDHANGDMAGHYRVSLNRLTCTGYGKCPPDRWERLEIPLKAWRSSGDHIVICPISNHVAQFVGVQPREWIKGVLWALGKATKRDIVIKPKQSDQSLSDVFVNAHAVVGYHSNAMVDAVIAGVPAYAIGPSPVVALGNTDLSQIDRPVLSDREPWLHNLAYHQFLLDEFKDGSAWKLIEGWA
jgi:hypothetical protein